ncbi:MAG TPA: hypothetical protein VHL78_13385 [Actinomycetota bacterium]|nr:hypothetical protein [Actinomycetota bacterium]
MRAPGLTMGPDMETTMQSTRQEARTDARVLVDLRALDLRTKAFAELRALSADTERPKPRPTLG